jgi:hypothetical protein
MPVEVWRGEAMVGAAARNPPEVAEVIDEVV